MTDTATNATPPDAPAPPARRRRSIIYLLALIVILVSLALGLAGSPWLAHSHIAPPIANSTQVEGGVNARLDALEQKTAELNEKVNALQSAGHAAMAPETAPQTASAPSISASDLARMQSDYVAMAASLAALQKQMQLADSAAATARGNAQSVLASLIAFLQLRDAGLSGHGFANELSAMRNASKSDGPLTEQLAKLDAYAAKGAPTDSQLREELGEQESAAISATEKAQAEHWWDRIWIEIKSLVTIRPLHGGGMTATFTTIDEDLAASNEQGALETFKTLWPESQKVLATWQAEVEARQAIDDAMRAIAAHFTTVAAPAAETPAPSPAP